MINFKQFLLEVNSTDFNGTGNTPPPTVMYPTINTTTDSPETMTTSKPPQFTNDQNYMDNSYWSRWLQGYSDDMNYFGASPEQIQKLLNLLRQQYFLYQSGSQGSMDSLEILDRMDRFYNNLLKKQSWYQDFQQNAKLRTNINAGIDKVNTYINPMGNIPIIPNINDFQRSAYP